MTTETLRVHKGEIGRLADGSLPGVVYRQDVVYDTGQAPDVDYLGALTCVNDVLTSNMLEIPAAKVVIAGSPGGNLPRAAIASAIPPTPHYYIQMEITANQASEDSFLGMYARYSEGDSSGSPTISGVKYYLLKVFPLVGANSVFQLIRQNLLGNVIVFATVTQPPLFGGGIKIRWELTGGRHKVKLNGTVILQAGNYAIRTKGGVGLVVMDGSIPGRDIKITEVKAAGLPYVCLRALTQQSTFKSEASTDGPRQKMALNSDGNLAVVGAMDDTNGANVDVNGHIIVYTKTGGVWSETTRLADPILNGDGMGYFCDLADDGSIVASGFVTQEIIRFFRQTSPTTWTGGTVTAPEQIRFCRISRDGNVFVAGGANVLETYIYVWNGTTYVPTWNTGTGGNPWYGGADISDDGKVVVLQRQFFNGVDIDVGVDVYKSTDLSTWTLDQTVGPINTGGGGTDYDDIALSADLGTIVVGDTSWQDGLHEDGAIFILNLNDDESYTSVARISTVLQGAFLGQVIALSHDGAVLLLGMPFGDVNSEGFAYRVDCLQDVTGNVELEDVGTEITRTFDATQGFFGLSVACDRLGDQIGVFAGDFDESGNNDVEFIRVS